MRKIIVSEFITLDNVIEGPGAMDNFKYAGWSMSYGNAELMKFKFEELFAADALLLGRVTYDGFAAAWPKIQGSGEFGEKMNSMQKLVASNSLQNLEWNNSHQIKNIEEEVSKLKEAEGKDILVFGSSVLIEELIKLNLIDEYSLLVYPLILGEGKRLFKNSVNVKLSLIEKKAFNSGVILLRYSVNK